MRELEQEELRWASGGYFSFFEDWGDETFNDWFNDWYWEDYTSLFEVETIVVTANYYADTFDEDYLTALDYVSDLYQDSGFYQDIDNDTGGSNDTDTTNEVDRSVIRAHEGGVLTNGYVPRDRHGNVIGHSGVTVGSGVDLGQQSVQTLQGWGVDQSLIDKLAPYLGKTGQDAVDYLTNHPLTLTQAEADALTTKAEDAFISDVAQRYNDDSNLNFYALAPEAQTVIVDLAYQYGANLEGRTPNFWDQVTSGNWNDAYNNLMDFGDDYDTRRESEADLLKEAIDDNRL